MRKVWWLGLAVVLLTAAVRWPLVRMEFGRNGDGTGSLYCIIARNYLLRDNGPTLWMPVLSIHAVDAAGKPVEPTLYAHHPPTVPLTLAAAFALLGESDFAARLPAYLFTLASVAAVFGLMLPRAGPTAATCAAAMLAFVPLSLRFGQMPDVVNSQLVFAGILILWAYLRMVERMETGGQRVWRTLGVVVAALAFGMLTDWPAFFLVPVLVVHLAWRRPGGGRRWLIPAAAISVVACAGFAGLYAWVSLATSDWGLILRQFLNRSTQSQLDNAKAFSWSTWAEGVWVYNRVLHTWPLLAAALAGWAAVCVFRRGTQLRGPDAAVPGPIGSPQTESAGSISAGRSTLAAVVGLPVAWAVLHVIVGRQGALNHDWWWWPVTLALCVSAAGLVAVVATTPRRAIACSVLVAALCAVWTVTELRHLHSRAWIYGAIDGYTAKQLGEAIRTHTPPGRAAVVFERDEQPYLVYYADRPLIQQVWDEPTLRRRINANRGDLFYTFTQSLGQPPATFVLPKAYEPRAARIIPYLTQHHPETDAGPFRIFDLTRPK